MGESLAVLAGALLGAFFFGTLWVTVRRAVGSGQPALWFAASMLVRTLLTLTGFYLVSRGDWSRLPFCLLGFFLANVAVRIWGRAPRAESTAASSQSAPEATDAP
jgi:F1F0 ATPase subunit 2